MTKQNIASDVIRDLAMSTQRLVDALDNDPTTPL